MKILFAADGSPYTRKALDFLVTHEQFAAGAEIVVLNVQPPLPPRVKSFVGSDAITGYHEEEAQKVLQPIDEFLKGRGATFRTLWVEGHPADEIVQASEREGAHLVVMGTHGYGALGRALMGSVAQNVVTGSRVPVLLVK